MKQEPVAWVDFDIEGVPVQLDYEWGCKMQKLKTRVPLYTTPQYKELSDEEYERIMKQWDYWRKQIANGDKSSAPRDWFESILEKFY